MFIIASNSELIYAADVPILERGLNNLEILKLVANKSIPLCPSLIEDKDQQLNTNITTMIACYGFLNSF